jgi:hypothetical protein
MGEVQSRDTESATQPTSDVLPGLVVEPEPVNLGPMRLSRSDDECLRRLASTVSGDHGLDFALGQQD